MRRTVLRELLERTPPGDAVELIDDMLRRGRRAEPPFDHALVALAAATTDEDGSLSYACRAALYEAARQRDLEPVAGYFLSARERAAPASQAERALLPQGRPLTLGERKALARRPVGQWLDRLARDPDPAVIRALLANPRLTEQEVVIVAALRPQSPDNLREVFRSRRWSSRTHVRRALAFNPDTPGDVAVRVLPLLAHRDLVDLSQDHQVQEAVRKGAAALVTRRKEPV